LPQLTGSVAFAGGLHDPVASLILCTPGYVDLSVINGEIVVRDGQLLTCDLDVSPAAAAAACMATFMGGGSCSASGSCGGAAATGMHLLHIAIQWKAVLIWYASSSSSAAALLLSSACRSC
jgi:hypothetical protein